MKILKEKTYSNLLNEIDELKKTNENLQKHESYLQNELNELRQEYRDFVIITKLNFNIKRFVLGKKGSGKTTFIKEILPKIKAYYIVDFTGEYDYVNSENRLCIDLNEKINTSDILEKIEQNKDKLIIIDGIELIGSIDWFMLNSRRYNYIISSQSKNKIEKYIDSVDCVYDFGTSDEFSKKLNQNKVVVFQRTES